MTLNTKLHEKAHWHCIQPAVYGAFWGGGQKKKIVILLQPSKELQTELKTHGTKIDGAQFFMQLQKEDND